MTYALRSRGNVCFNKLRLKPYNNIRVSTFKIFTTRWAFTEKRRGSPVLVKFGETPFVQIISDWRPAELPEFPGWRTRSITTMKIPTDKKLQIFMGKPHCFRSIIMLTAYRLTKLFHVASLHFSKCSVHDEIKKYEIDLHVARIREARCWHSILVCRSGENVEEREEQNVRACTGLNRLRIGSCDEFSLIMS